MVSTIKGGGAHGAARDVSGIILRLREIATALPTNDDAAAIAPADAEGIDDDTWQDSTLALERGLDVVELEVEPLPSKTDPAG